MAKPLERATNRAPCKLNNEKHVLNNTLDNFLKRKLSLMNVKEQPTEILE